MWGRACRLLSGRAALRRVGVPRRFLPWGPVVPWVDGVGPCLIEAGEGTEAEAMVARVYITLKPGVLDPAGKAVESSLHTLGFPGVRSVRLGKYLELQLPDGDSAMARAQVEEMCKKLLANTVVENFRIELAG